MQAGNGRAAIIADIDGFLVDSSARLKKYINLEAKAAGDWKTFYASLDEYNATTEGDELIPEGVALLEGERLQRPDAVVFYVTARGANGRIPTFNYLREHIDPNVQEWQLIQRGELDLEECKAFKISEFKRERLCHLRDMGYEVVQAFDDHPEIHEMYEQEGVPSTLFVLDRVDCLTGFGEGHLREKQMAIAAK